MIANLQVSESANLGLTYRITPKVDFTASAFASRSSGLNGSPTSTTLNPLLQPFTQNSSSYGANASINYVITPFIAANLSYTHTRTLQANFLTPSDVVLLALNFNPY